MEEIRTLTKVVKKEHRRVCRERRLSLALDRGNHEKIIVNLLALLTEINPRSVGLYSAMKGEIDLADALLQWAEARGVTLALPFVYKESLSMQYRLWGAETPVVKDTAGIPSSIGEEIIPELVLAPCVAYGQEGCFRLGNGGGYFDRWMSQHAGVHAIGIAFDDLVVPDEVFDELDIPMTWIVTEKRQIAR